MKYYTSTRESRPFNCLHEVNLLFWAAFQTLKPPLTIFLTFIIVNQGLCNYDEFECDNGECVSENLQCNNIDDCGDNSDEENCGMYFIICNIDYIIMFHKAK